MIDLLEDYSQKNSPEFFKSVSLEDLKSVVNTDPIKDLQPSRYQLALEFFKAYQDYFRLEDLRRELPQAYYLSLKRTADLSLALDEKAVNRDWHIVNWMRVCYRAGKSPNIAYFLSLYGIDPEDEVRRFLYESGKTEPDRLRKVWEKEEMATIARQLAEWFLLRYDREEASTLLHILHKTNPSFWSHISKVLFAFALFILVLGCFGIYIFPTFAASLPAVLAAPDKILTVPVQPSLLALLLPIIYIVLLMWIAFRSKIWLKLMIPRLFAGILVGYLSLLFSHDLWDFAVRIQNVKMIMLVFASLTLSYFFVQNKISRIIASRKEVMGRAWKILTVGLYQAFAGGIILCDIFSRAMLSGLNGQALPVDLILLGSSFGGVVAPKILFLFAPLALLIGIFIQLLWDETPLTEGF